MHFFRDKQGNLTLWQRPNLPLCGWIVLTLLSRLTDNQYLRRDFMLLGMASLFTWAFLELTQGSSYFRRTLGAVVLIGTVVGFVRI